jgi:hypothetical protein
MLKKLIVTVMAAGALSVPLAGVAWGDPDPTDPNGNGIGTGGVPGKIASVIKEQGVPVVGKVTLGTGNDDTPGVTIIGTSDIAKMPGSVPDFTTSIAGVRSPGAVVKAVTPGCVNGSLGCP